MQLKTKLKIFIQFYALWVSSYNYTFEFIYFLKIENLRTLQDKNSEKRNKENCFCTVCLKAISVKLLSRKDQLCFLMYFFLQ